MPRFAFAVLLTLSALAAQVFAGEYNPVLNIGDPAPVWTDLPGVDGKKHSLADLKDKQVLIVVFTCNSCPVAQDYEDRIIALAHKHAGPQGKAAMVAINVNKIEDDSLPKMQERAKSKGFSFPYLFDETQKIAKDFGATYTPEFFVFNKDRKLVYMGGMDDNSNAAKVTVNYLEPAIDAAAAGTKPAITETVARGCLVRYARERRKK